MDEELDADDIVSCNPINDSFWQSVGLGKQEDYVW